MANTAARRAAKTARPGLCDSVTMMERAAVLKMGETVLRLAQEVVSTAVRQGDMETLDRVARCVVTQGARQMIAHKLR